MTHRIRLFVLSFSQRSVLTLATLPAHAHVGSPDVYVEGNAGPYKLSIVVRPPLVIPGVAEIEVRSQTPGIDRIEITPIPLTGEGSKHPPVPDTMQRPSADTRNTSPAISGSWPPVPGRSALPSPAIKGQGVFSVPVPATAMGTRKMQPGLGFMLGYSRHCSLRRPGGHRRSRRSRSAARSRRGSASRTPPPRICRHGSYICRVARGRHPRKQVVGLKRRRLRRLHL